MCLVRYARSPIIIRTFVSSYDNHPHLNSTIRPPDGRPPDPPPRPPTPPQLDPPHPHHIAGRWIGRAIQWKPCARRVSMPTLHKRLTPNSDQQRGSLLVSKPHTQCDLLHTHTLSSLICSCGPMSDTVDMRIVRKCM